MNQKNAAYSITQLFRIPTSELPRKVITCACPFQCAERGLVTRAVCGTFAVETLRQFDEFCWNRHLLLSIRIVQFIVLCFLFKAPRGGAGTLSPRILRSLLDVVAPPSAQLLVATMPLFSILYTLVLCAMTGESRFGARFSIPR